MPSPAAQLSWHWGGHCFPPCQADAALLGLGPWSICWQGRAGQGWDPRDPHVVIPGKHGHRTLPLPREGKGGLQPHTLPLRWVIRHLSGRKGHHTSRESPPSRAALPGNKLRSSQGSCCILRGSRPPTQKQRRGESGTFSPPRERNGRGRSGTNGMTGGHKTGRQCVQQQRGRCCYPTCGGGERKTLSGGRGKKSGSEGTA